MGAGKDTISNYGDNVSINGDAGDDSINCGYSNSVTADGGAGNNLIFYRTGALSLSGGFGNDSIIYLTRCEC